jgi:hypothetical protein
VVRYAAAEEFPDAGLLKAILNPSDLMIAVTIEKENIDESQT